ncbi:hypothetical protein GOY07_02215 [Wolbachia endosymbiont of Litomosoides sigmodontis]|nr:hypothetical protein GOY07_02215 [Wolbachia endosymbiont of Litomosoides sigmodontis]
MKFHILRQDQSIMNKIKIDRKSFKKLNETISKYPVQELFIFDELQFVTHLKVEHE